MRWIAISGSWRTTNKRIEKDVRNTVRKIISQGNGIISGGALNVDYFAADEAIKLDPSCQKIKIFLPSILELFARHYLKRAKEKVIKQKQAEDLIKQLNYIKKINPQSLVENNENKVIDKKSYFQRISEIIKNADGLIAFHVNESEGVQDTINKGKKKGIPVKIIKYKI